MGCSSKRYSYRNALRTCAACDDFAVSRQTFFRSSCPKTTTPTPSLADAHYQKPYRGRKGPSQDGDLLCGSLTSVTWAACCSAACGSVPWCILHTLGLA